MKCVVNWIPLNTHVRFENTLPCLKGGPDAGRRINFAPVKSLDSSGHFHLIIPGNQKTEFQNPRLNSRPLLPFNQLGFDRIGGVVKNNGSHHQVL